MSDWLVETFGMDPGFARGMQFVIALVIVFGLFALLVFALRRLNGSTIKGGARNRQPRLAVMDHAHVDARRRLVLVRRDNVEHLLLIGGPTDVVVEQAITRGIAVGLQVPRAAYGVQPTMKPEPAGGAAGDSAAAPLAAAGAATVGAMAATAAEAAPAWPAPATAAALEPEADEAPAATDLDAALDPGLGGEDSLTALGREPAHEPKQRNKFRMDRPDAGAARRRLGEAAGLLGRRAGKEEAPSPEPTVTAEPKIAPEPAIRPEPATAKPVATPEPKAAPEPAAAATDADTAESTSKPVRTFGRQSRGPAAGLFGRERSGDGGERRPLSSLVAAASGASAAVLGKRAAAKDDTAAPAADAAPEPVVPTPAAAPPVAAPSIASPAAKAPAAEAPAVEAPTADKPAPDTPTAEAAPAEPEISVTVDAPKPLDTAATGTAGSLAGVTPEPARAKAGSEPAWLRDLQQGLDKELSAPAAPAKPARVEPSFVSHDDAEPDVADEAAPEPAVEPVVADVSDKTADTADDLEAALADAFERDLADKAGTDERSETETGDDGTAAPDDAVVAAPSSEPAASSAPEISLGTEPEKKPASDEIEVEMARLLDELTGKRD